MGKRKRYTAEEKTKILREVIEEGKPVSEVADRYELSPNNIFKWRKQFMESGIEVFRVQRTDISSKADQRKIAALEDKIKHKDEVIAELAEELLSLKKKSCGLR